MYKENFKQAYISEICIENGGNSFMLRIQFKNLGEKSLTEINKLGISDFYVFLLTKFADL